MPDGSRARKRFLSTVLMTDIVGSTELAAELGDTGWRDLVHMHHALVRAALRRHGGREIDTAGDGFFSVFDAPAAAVDCALEVASEVRKLGIEIRAGVHVGEVEEIAGKVGGISVPIAARIMSAAGAGEVLVSATVRELAAGSGLIFHDRGVRELKGVPGEWHVFAVGLAEPNPAELAGFPTAQERRAAAVRWSEARPFWQRHPRMTAVTGGALAVVLVTGGLLVWRPWQPPALASVAENSIGVIDPVRNELTGQIPVGIQPGGIAFGEGYVWVTNTGANTVSQIDVATHAAVNRIPVGRAPTGIVVAMGSVWVANSGGRTVSRINAATGQVVQDIDVGNGPTAIVVADDGLWVANATDSTAVRIDARTGQPEKPIGVAATPIALAADADALWVASEFVSVVSRLDPLSGLTVKTIQLSGRPSAIAVDGDSLWIAAADGTVTRIDGDDGRPTRTVDIGGQLSAIAIAGDSVWVGDRNGYVYRLSRSDTSSAPLTIAIISSVAALSVVEGNVWAAAQASVLSHRGGTLRIVEPFRIDTDPLGSSYNNASLLTADGLVGYRRVGGVAGAVLLPDLATSVPQPTDGGLTYTFQLRLNLTYSNGEPVRPADFRRAIERSFQIFTPGVGVSGQLFFDAIVGADACKNPAPPTSDPSPVIRCDLSEGILADEATNTVTFKLSQPDPDFLFKLAMLYAFPVPEGTPMHGVAMDGVTDGEFVGTGPYVVAAVSDSEVRLKRNPRFQVWDATVRPDGYPDEIVFSVVEDVAQQIAMVERDEADFLHLFRASPELIQGSELQYGGQWHFASNVTYAAWMNTQVAPFDNADVRRAVSLAIDRAEMADVYGGQPLVAVTCQVLPPGFPGYQPYCPATAGGAGDHWQARDLDAARRLVEASGTAGMQVAIVPTEGNPAARDLGLVLEELGYDVRIAAEGEGVAIFPVGWGPDYLAPSIFFNIFTCDRGNPFIGFCDPALDARIQEALELQETDPAAAWSAWAELDRRVVDLGLWAPLHNAGGDFVSARVGNYQFNPIRWALFDQMWVQTATPGSPTSPSPVPSMPTAAPTAGPSSPLEGTWATGETTCTDQNAAVEAAGFTTEQMALAGWTCRKGRPPESQFTIIFEAGRLLEFSDGGIGWNGLYRIVDEDTFQAGDDGSYYITYEYAIDGDQLTIDMTEDTCPRARLETLWANGSRRP